MIPHRGNTTLGPHYKGHNNSAYLVLTLIFAQILTSFDPETDPYILPQKFVRKAKNTFTVFH